MCIDVYRKGEETVGSVNGIACKSKYLGEEMSEAKFTPGVWTLDKWGKIQANGDTLLVNGVALPSGRHPQAGEADANRNLLLASKELLQTAKYFVEWVEDVWGSAALPEKAKKEYEFAKAAILKAEGN